MSQCTEKRCLSFNKTKSDWCLEVGSKVLLRIPGMHAFLQASWKGPYEVLEKVSRVTYKVWKGEGHPVRVVHINNTKVYGARETNVHSISVVAEEDEEMCADWDRQSVLSSTNCDGFEGRELAEVLCAVDSYFSDAPGTCKVGKCVIKLWEGAEVVNLPPRHLPVGIRKGVEDELEKMLDSGVIVCSDSEWSSPLVPVCKKDGSVRICVDFPELNRRTPLGRFWLPTLTEILENVGSSTCLSKLDMTSGLHQVKMDEASMELTPFVCPAEKFMFKCALWT